MHYPYTDSQVCFSGQLFPAYSEKTVTLLGGLSKVVWMFPHVHNCYQMPVSPCGVVGGHVTSSLAHE